MDLKLRIHLILLCVLNVIFFFSGVVLNTLVIITILKTTQLRKKFCHFMIMVLSCSDLLTVVMYSLGLLLNLIILFTENKELDAKLTKYRYLLVLFGGFSMFTLLVMCIERYLGIYYPIFHKTSVTRCRLLTLLAILLIPTTILGIISTNDLVISSHVGLRIFMIILCFCMFQPFFALSLAQSKDQRQTTQGYLYYGSP